MTAENIAVKLRGLTFNGNTGAFVRFSENETSGNGVLRLEPGDIENSLQIKEDVKTVFVKGIGSFKLEQARRIAVVTGGAQGFGAGIVKELVKKDVYVFIADLNIKGAEDFADKINMEHGSETAAAVEVNVSDEASVETMFNEVVLKAGGLDLFVNNAGVLKAGSVKELELADFEFVTKVNYTGYFICTKFASRIMAAQNKAAAEANLGSYYTDIIQINSKSGLQGSNKNGAYAGGKFGGIGLTQSFAMELISDNIKVNSICPGNFFEGPLWSDPERGLFKQYLDTGKVPEAQTVEDVKAFYESKVPMGRGCQPEDIAKALFYLVDQKYETGQALPVTGGQVMLK